MRRALLLILLLSFSALPAQAARVLYIELKGTINPGSAEFVLDSLHAAEAGHVDALVLRLNTPGGLLSSTRRIIEGFSASSVPVITWISPGGASATSAGALITLSSHVAALAPGTNIGAAHPVGSQGEDVKGTMGEKVTNDTAALARAQAALRGRNPETAESIVTKSRSFSPEEAVKNGAADFVAGDLESLLRQASGRAVRVENPRRELKLQVAGAQVEKREMNARQGFLHFISDPNVSTVLITLGGLALWAEVSSGFTSIVAGIVGIFCFLLGFISLETLPVTTGGVALLCLGFVLLIAEAFVTSYGLLTVASLAAILLGGLFLIDPAGGSMRVSHSLLGSIVLSIGAILLIVGYELARDRHRRRSTRDPVVGGTGRVSTVDAGGRGGTVYVNGELWDFDSAEPLQAGDMVHVHAVNGMRLQLEKRSN